jgi:hypothetical protein
MATLLYEGYLIVASSERMETVGKWSIWVVCIGVPTGSGNTNFSTLQLLDSTPRKQLKHLALRWRRDGSTAEHPANKIAQPSEIIESFQFPDSEI